MYKDHFGLYTSPFGLSPRLQFVFRSTTFEETMAHLIYGIEGGEEIMLITGEIGTGKTLALQNLAEHISSSYAVALINVTQIDFKELLKLLLAELGVTIPTGADRADLLTALKVQLIALGREGRRCLLIVDEAQNLELATLEGVRLLANLGPGDRQVLQIVLSGQPMLRSHVDHPELLQLRQRIRVHYHLVTLTESETHKYIEHRLKVAGADRPIFRSDAVRRIHELSMGIPRLVNIVADRALLSAFVDGAREVVAKHIEDDPSIVRSPVAESRQAKTASLAAEPAPLSPEPLPEDPEHERPDGRSLSGRWLAVAVVAMVIVVGFLAVRLGWLPTAGGDGPTDAEQTPIVAAVVLEDSIGSDIAIVDLVTELTDTVNPESTEMMESGNGMQQEELPEPEPFTADSSGDMLESSTEDIPLESAESRYLVDQPTGIHLHISSFQDLERADHFAEVLSAEGYPTLIKVVTIQGVLWYRVYIGPWADLDAAQAAQQGIHASSLIEWSMIIRLR